MIQRIKKTPLQESNIQCEACGLLFAWIEIFEDRHTVELIREMTVKVYDETKRTGAIVCPCGHETPIDLDTLGPEPK